MSPVSVTFTHLFTEKKLFIFDRTHVGAIIHGDAVTGGKTVPGATFLCISTVKEPIAIKETAEEVMHKLGLAPDTNKEKQ